MAANKKKTKPIQFQIGWAGLIALIISSFCALLWTFVLGFWMGQKVATGNCPKTKVAVYNPKSHTTNVKPSEPTQGLIKEAQLQKSLALKELEEIKQNIKTDEEQRAEDKLKTEVLDETESLLPKTPEKQDAKKVDQEKEKKIEEKAEKKAKEQEIRHVESKPKKGKTVNKNASKSASLKKYFSLQIASYKSIEHAKKEAKAWEKKGYFVKIKKANLGRKGIWYRVYIGKYKTLEEAKKASVRLASKEGIRSYVASFGK